MSKIKVTMTYLVEDEVEYESDIALSSVERVMEDGGVLFEHESLLIGNEIGLNRDNVKVIKGDKIHTRRIISNPHIIKLEKI